MKKKQQEKYFHFRSSVLIVQLACWIYFIDSITFIALVINPNLTVVVILTGHCVLLLLSAWLSFLLRNRQQKLF